MNPNERKKAERVYRAWSVFMYTLTWFVLFPLMIALVSLVDTVQSCRSGIEFFAS